MFHLIDCSIRHNVHKLEDYIANIGQDRKTSTASLIMCVLLFALTQVTYVNYSTMSFIVSNRFFFGFRKCYQRLTMFYQHLI